MGSSQTLVGTCVGNLQLLRQLHDGGIDRLGPAQSLLKDQLGICVSSFSGSLGNTVIAQGRSGICPVYQCIHAGDLLVFAIDLLQRHGKTLEPVDATGHGEQVDDVPAVQNFILPCFQAPLGNHAGAEAMEMLAVHGIHDAAVGVHADQIIVLSFKGVKNGHYKSPYIWVSIMPQYASMGSVPLNASGPANRASTSASMV